MKTMHTSAALAALLWSVSLSAATAPPIAKVLVTNPVLPVEVRNADPIPVTAVGEPAELFAKTLLRNIGADQSAVFSFDIPDGKRLIIETVSVAAQMPVGSNVTFTMIAYLGDSSHNIALPVQDQGVIPESGIHLPKQTYAGTHSIRVRADGGARTDDLSFVLDRSAVAGENTSNNDVAITVLGYLVNQ